MFLFFTKLMKKCVIIIIFNYICIFMDPKQPQAHLTLPYHDDMLEAIYRFVEEHRNADATRLLLSGKTPCAEFPLRFAAVQIDCRRKAAAKIPDFLRHREFLFPDAVSSEQASHQAVARYNAGVTGHAVKVLDMTAGLGIDALTSALSGNTVTAIDLDARKAAVLLHNAIVTGVSSLTVTAADSVEWLKESRERFDAIFIDPARRSAGGGRVYAFSDCMPDITSIMDMMLNHAPRVVVKCSPMLDVAQVRHELPGVAQLHAVGVKGECKELLAVVDRDATGYRETAVELDTDGHIVWKMELNPDSDPSIRYLGATPGPGQWLYEPDATVMKFQPWGELSERYPALAKAARTTHLFLGDELYDDFPGRIFRIGDIVDKKKLRALKGTQLNVAVRNYPETADSLRRRYHIGDGGEGFLYGFSSGAGKHLALCRRHQKRNPAESTI